MSHDAFGKLAEYGQRIAASMARIIPPKWPSPALPNAGDAAEASRRDAEEIADVVARHEAAMPNLIFRCAVCSWRVGRRRKHRRYQVPTDFECRNPKGAHGRLRDITDDEIMQAWTRRGEPETLDVYLSPVS